MPVAEPTVAIAVLPLVQAPPGVASVRVVVKPIHCRLAPLMAAGVRFTESVRDTEQPVPSEYTIVVVPGSRPVAAPVVTSILAIVVADDVHVPPGTLLPRPTVAPWHTAVAPVIGPGVGFTFRVAIA